MSRRNKLKKFADILDFPNVYENFDFTKPVLTGTGNIDFDAKGNWNAKHFKNDNPITLELACGRGEYTLGLAKRYPDRNFIGVDIKGARIWQGATLAMEQNIENVAFVRTQIEQIAEFFAPGEVAEIWITFPDPYLREGKAGKRLTSHRFLNLYRKVGVPGLPVHLKTDSAELYEFSVDSVSSFGAQIECSVEDIDAATLPVEESQIPTYYERMHRGLGKPLKYLRFRL